MKNEFLKGLLQKVSLYALDAVFLKLFFYTFHLGVVKQYFARLLCKVLFE